ncbi:MAG: TusE/DsrC/DsvC family sulfur relay protein [Pseudomonadota bacterium]
MNDDQTLLHAGHRIALDGDGHLSDPSDWSRGVAEALAEADGMALGPDHWWVIDFVRAHHQRYGNPPLMRVLISAFRTERADHSLSSRDLYRLFDENPVRQACRLGGYPKPDWCI